MKISIELKYAEFNSQWATPKWFADELYDKNKLEDNVMWIKNLEKTKQCCYKASDNSLIVREISGGIIIDPTSNWTKLFDQQLRKTLIVTENKTKQTDTQNTQNTQNTVYTQVKSEYDNVFVEELDDFHFEKSNGENYDKIVFDISSLNINKFAENDNIYKVNSKNRWIHLSENIINSHNYLFYLKILIGDINLKFPIYTDKSLKSYYCFKGHARQFQDITNVIKITRTKYKLDENNKNLINILDTQQLDMLELNYLEFKNKLSANEATLWELNECSICMYQPKITNACITKCKHYFCLACILKWILIKKTCPVCRAQSLINDIFPLKFSQNKIEIINKQINNLKSNLKNKNKNKKVIIYTKNKLIGQYYKKNISTTNIELYYNSKWIPPNWSHGCIFVDPIFSETIKSIRGITNIIVCDSEYKYITKKECLGYDLLNNNKNIEIDIIEPDKQE